MTTCGPGKTHSWTTHTHTNTHAAGRSWVEVYTQRALRCSARLCVAVGRPENMVARRSPAALCYRRGPEPERPQPEGHRLTHSLAPNHSAKGEIHTLLTVPSPSWAVCVREGFFKGCDVLVCAHNVAQDDELLSGGTALLPVGFVIPPESLQWRWRCHMLAIRSVNSDKAHCQIEIRQQPTRSLVFSAYNDPVAGTCFSPFAQIVLL